MTDLELIAALEQATGPSRELANEVLFACGWTQQEDGPADNPKTYWVFKDEWTIDGDQPDPTSSIDAALTLKPSNATSWDCGQIDQDFLASVEFAVDVDGFHSYHAKSQANAAIALCVASLKARAASPPTSAEGEA